MKKTSKKVKNNRDEAHEFRLFDFRVVSKVDEEEVERKRLASKSQPHNNYEIKLDFNENNSIYEAIVRKENNSYNFIELYETVNFNDQKNVLNWLMEELSKKKSNFVKISKIRKIKRYLRKDIYVWYIVLNFFDIRYAYDIIIHQKKQPINKMPIKNIFSIESFEPILDQRHIGNLRISEDENLYNGKFKNNLEHIFHIKHIAKNNTHKLKPTKPE